MVTVNAMGDKCPVPVIKTKKALDAFMAAITKALKAGDKVSLVGFGTFVVAERAARLGINPSTKQSITIPAKRVAKFKPGMELTLAIG